MRNKDLQEYIDSQSKKLYGRTKSEAHKIRQCVACRGVATEFADKLSEGVYDLMGICQHCQDQSDDNVNKQAHLLVMMVDLLGFTDKQRN